MSSMFEVEGSDEEINRLKRFFLLLFIFIIALSIFAILWIMQDLNFGYLLGIVLITSFIFSTFLIIDMRIRFIRKIKEIHEEDPNQSINTIAEIVGSTEEVVEKVLEKIEIKKENFDQTKLKTEVLIDGKSIKSSEQTNKKKAQKTEDIFYIINSSIVLISLMFIVIYASLMFDGRTVEASVNLFIGVLLLTVLFIMGIPHYLIKKRYIKFEKETKPKKKGHRNIIKLFIIGVYLIIIESLTLLFSGILIPHSIFINSPFYWILGVLLFISLLFIIIGFVGMIRDGKKGSNLERKSINNYKVKYHNNKRKKGRK